MSDCELLFGGVVRAASVFARPLKRGELDEPEAIGDVEGKDWEGAVPWDASEL